MVVLDQHKAVASHAAYLRPGASPYVQPLPQEFSAKNDPLSLLAKTCERIGGSSLEGPANRSTSGVNNSSKVPATSSSLFSPPVRHVASSSASASSPRCSSSASETSACSPKSSSSEKRKLEEEETPTKDESAEDLRRAKKSPRIETTAAVPSVSPQRPTPTLPAVSSSSLMLPGALAGGSHHQVPCANLYCRDPGCAAFKQLQHQQYAAAAAAAANAAAAAARAYSLPAHYLMGGTPPGLPAGPFGAPGFPYSLPHPMLMAPPPFMLPAAATPPSPLEAKTFVCHWVTNGATCAKTFSSAADLDKHLQTHDFSGANSAKSTPTSTAAAAVAAAAAAAVAAASPSSSSAPTSALAALQAQAAISLAATSSAPDASLQQPSVSSPSSLRFSPYTVPSSLSPSLLPGLPPHLSAPFPPPPPPAL